MGRVIGIIVFFFFAFSIFYDWAALERLAIVWGTVSDMASYGASAMAAQGCYTDQINSDLMAWAVGHNLDTSKITVSPSDTTTAEPYGSNVNLTVGYNYHFTFTLFGPVDSVNLPLQGYGGAVTYDAPNLAAGSCTSPTFG